MTHKERDIMDEIFFNKLRKEHKPNSQGGYQAPKSTLIYINH